MSVYIVAHVRIHDRTRYDRYAAGFLPTLKPYGGRLLASDDAPETLEGGFSHGKLNIIAFPDAESARAWSAGPEYQAIVADRLEASEAIVLMARGFGRS
jgi:uncharacterized protein (DUF1330 family)